MAVFSAEMSLVLCVSKRIVAEEVASEPLFLRLKRGNYTGVI